MSIFFEKNFNPNLKIFQEEFKFKFVYYFLESYNLEILEV
jgi:hypothetical protein